MRDSFTMHYAQMTGMCACAGAQGLLQAARFPLDKRPLQLHNLNLALTALHGAGIDAKVWKSQTGPLQQGIRCWRPLRNKHTSRRLRLLCWSTQRPDGLSSVRAENIANGDCAATLSLLWQLAVHLEVGPLTPFRASHAAFVPVCLRAHASVVSVATK